MVVAAVPCQFPLHRLLFVFDHSANFKAVLSHTNIYASKCTTADGDGIQVWHAA